MLDAPWVTQTPRLVAAVIHLTVPRNRIREVMGPAMAEVTAAVADQGVGPAGPVFSHHLRTDPDAFDFEVGVPVSAPIAPVGRVRPGELPAARVARTVHRGPYDGLGAAWGEFMAGIKAAGHRTRADFWEVYIAGPESNPDPATWQTELNRPLTG